MTEENQEQLQVQPQLKRKLTQVYLAVWIDKNLLKEFDQIRKRLYYNKRSEAVREAVKLFIKTHRDEVI